MARVAPNSPNLPIGTHRPDEMVCRARCKCCFYSILSVGTISLGVYLLILLLPYTNTDPPLFNVESVSVNVIHDLVYSHNESRLVTTRWDLGFSIRNPNKGFVYYYRDLEVFVRCMSRDWSGAVVRGFRQGTKNTTILNATVDKLLPIGLDSSPSVRGFVWDFAVMFKVRYKNIVEAICRDMRVVFSENATIGVMVEGPILCPLEIGE